MSKKPSGSRDFNKVGQVTWGNPNDYSDASGGWLLEEVRRRAKDDDEGGRSVASFYADMKEAAREEGLTIRAFVGEGDCLIDLLSDTAPEGFEFGVRKWSDGNYNAGYYLIGMKDEY